MGQGSKSSTWSTRGSWIWKEEDSINEKEDPKGRGTENWGKNIVTIGTRLVIKSKRNIYKN